ncbi:oligoendopeptidase F [Lactobacillus sp. ESL0228]|uniref:oligoendopeptidase F n=1 Tax=Lactobacillus sp. ESL0228 TaxID=2069352 RepID=UPI000EFB7BEC|nr:oligoendopeptidase F [Lactobacillus sp. ESL0228]RMC47245.1 oligoendopeptidase F [Lactobacillus sp. ESL0228]
MTIPKRTQVPTKLKWDLTRVFKSDNEWIAEYQQIKQEIPTLSKLRSDFISSGQKLYTGLTKILDIRRRLEKVYTYATMASDVDTSNTHYLGYVAQAQTLANEFESVTAFINPTILNLSPEKLHKFMQQEPYLNKYQHLLDEIIQMKPHTLSSNDEKLIAAAGDALENPENTYNVLTNSDMEYGYVQNDDGEMVQLSDGLYSLLIQSQKREVRHDAFDSMYATYGQFQNTLASTLAGVVKKHNYLANIHHYDSACNNALSENCIPKVVYDTLIKEVDDHLNLLHDYVFLRKQLLQLDDLQMWDMYVPLTGTPSLSYTFDQAKNKTKEALEPLGSDYLKQVDYIFNNRVIDVVESQHKVIGAYSGGSYDTDAYELLNWNDSVDSLYTLVHETGHSVHSMYTRQNQPYAYGDYPIFVAEIASTTNENILTEYFLNHLTEPKERAFILNYYLDSFKGTLFRQTQFAEFEQYIHEMDAQGEPLTADFLNDAYGKLNQRYYGDAVEEHSDIDKEWARIPHFYYNFYVYQYATGFAAATALANNIVHGTYTQKENYINFLKSGSSNYPVEIMKKAGIDMTKPDYLEEAFKTFAQRLEEFKSIIKNNFK